MVGKHRVFHRKHNSGRLQKWDNYYHQTRQKQRKWGIKMKESSLLEILANERMFTVLETALDNSTDYQEAVKAERKAYKKLKKTNLNDRQKALLDRVIDTSNHSNSIYGTIAYSQGFQDGMKLLSELKEIF